ncbi:MAG: FlgD immunoglobulin-like domain containing protein, partial [Candidatus Latescibacterota bacterium]
IRVELTDTGGLIYPFDLPFDLFPAGDLQIVDDGLTSGWVAEGSRGADMPVPVDFAGETALAVPVNSTGSFWKLDLKPPQPVNPFGYTHLRFAIHPGTLEGRAFNMVIANARVNLVDKDTGPLVDLERKEWQLVELALSEIGVTSPIELINLTGNLSGTFYLYDMRLVAAPPPAMPTAVLEEHTDVQPTVFTLLQNYPNPFNPETTIRFDLPKAQEIELVIYNLAAQTVATLVQGHRAAGSYSVRWDGRTDAGLELASGVYVYRLTSEERVETRKLLLMK